MPDYCRDTLAALYIMSSTRKFHTNSSTAVLPTLQPSEHLVRNAIYIFLDTLGGVHKCNFMWCLDFKHCETHFNSSQIKVKANKYFTYEIHTVYWGFWRCRTERKGNCRQSRYHMTQTLKVSLHTAQWKADLLHMHCQDSCCTEHPFVLEKRPWEISWMGAKGCLVVSPPCSSWLELKRRMWGYPSIAHLSQMFYFQTLLPSGSAGDISHGQPLPSSIGITNGFYLVFLLCLIFSSVCPHSS